MPAELGKNESVAAGWLFNNRVSISLGMVGIFLVGVGIFATLIIVNAKNKPSIEILSASPQVEQTLTVYVTGSVEKPGLYQLAANSRINDALIAAGGLSAEADRNWLEKTINLAQRISDGSKIYVPSKVDKVNESRAEVEKNNILGDQTKVNLNTATKAELESLPGIGEVFSQRIIDYRVTQGQFASVDDLLKVEGIGNKLIEKIRDKVEI